MVDHFDHCAIGALGVLAFEGWRVTARQLIVYTVSGHHCPYTLAEADCNRHLPIGLFRQFAVRYAALLNMQLIFDYTIICVYMYQILLCGIMTIEASICIRTFSKSLVSLNIYYLSLLHASTFRGYTLITYNLIVTPLDLLSKM